MQENYGGNQINAIPEMLISVKRIEFLLEELIFQQCLSRTNDIQAANEKLKNALQNVSESMKHYAQQISEIDTDTGKD